MFGLYNGADFNEMMHFQRNEEKLVHFQRNGAFFKAELVHFQRNSRDHV